MMSLDNGKSRKTAQFQNINSNTMSRRSERQFAATEGSLYEAQSSNTSVLCICVTVWELAEGTKPFPLVLSLVTREQRPYHTMDASFSLFK